MGGTSSKPMPMQHTRDSKASSTPIIERKEQKQKEVKAGALTLWQGPAEEALHTLWNLNLDTKVIFTILLPYWNFDCLELEAVKHDRPVKININQSFFGKSSLPALATHFALYGMKNELMAIVNTNRAMLSDPDFPVFEARDPRGRKIRAKSLLGYAAASNSFDPFEMDKKGEHHGIVETLAELLPKEVVEAQLAEQFRPGSKEKTAVRMNKIYDAVITAGEVIIATQVPAGSTVRAECKSFMENWCQSMEPNPDEVIDCGIIFDPDTIKRVREWYRTNFPRFVDVEKHYLFLEVVYGTLQKLPSPDDAHVINFGVYNVVECRQLPPRTLKLKDGSSYYSSNLGVSFCIDDSGLRARLARWEGWGDWGAARLLENLCRAKTSALQNLCGDRTVNQVQRPRLLHARQ